MTFIILDIATDARLVETAALRLSPCLPLVPRSFAARFLRRCALRLSSCVLWSILRHIEGTGQVVPAAKQEIVSGSQLRLIRLRSPVPIRRRFSLIDKVGNGPVQAPGNDLQRPQRDAGVASLDAAEERPGKLVASQLREGHAPLPSGHLHPPGHTRREIVQKKLVLMSHLRGQDCSLGSRGMVVGEDMRGPAENGRVPDETSVEG